MISVHVSLLGSFAARLASGEPLRLPRAKARALLAVLALQRDRTCARDTIAALLWPDLSQEQARHSLRQTLFTLRKADPALDLALDGDALALPTFVGTDVTDFERFVAAGTPRDLASAVRLYRGELVEGLRVNEEPFEEWLRGERRRLREVAIDALRRLLSHYSTTGATADAVHVALRLTTLDALQEEAHRALMTLYAATGRRACALRQYDTCARALKHELGVAPAPETTRLFQEIRTRDRDSARVTECSTWSPASGADRLPLAGRDSELAVLMNALEAAIGGHGAMIAIVGEAGVGKTRLVEELVEHAQRRAVGGLIGRSFEMEQALSFGPWLDALRPVVADQRHVLRDLDPVWRRELARLLPEADPEAPAQATSSDRQAQLFEAVARLVHRLGEQRPHLVVIEDLHWADDLSLRLLSFIAHRIADHRVLMIATARDDEVAALPALRTFFGELDRDGHSLRVRLDPLSRPALATLLASRPAETRDTTAAALPEQRVWELSEGNAFVALELVRAVHGSADGATGDRPVLPVRVTELITQRLDQLGERARHLVAVAAVMGRQFDSALLQRAAGTTTSETAATVEALLDGRVFAVRGDTIDFIHDRVREVALASLVPPLRAQLHACIAAAIEDTYRGDLAAHAGRLALHYGHGRIWDKALQFLLVAAHQAATRGAHREAVACYEQAVSVMGHLPAADETVGRTIDVLFAMRFSLVVLDERDRIEQCLREAERRAIEIGDSRRRGWAICYRSRELLASGEITRSRDHAQRALAIGDATADEPLKLASSYRLAQGCLSAGDYPQARDRMRAIVTATRLDSTAGDSRLGLLTVQARAWLAWALGEMGELDEAVSWGQDAVQVAESFPDEPYALGWAYTGLAEVYRIRGEMALAIGVLERLERLVSHHDMPDLSISMTRTLGNAYALSGRLREGLALLRTARAKLEDVASRRPYATAFLEQLGRACLLDRRIAEARDNAEGALARARSRGERGAEAYALWLCGDVARCAENFGMADRRYREAIALADELGMKPLAARVHAAFSMLCRRTGRVEPGRRHAAAARTMAAEMGLRELRWLRPEPAAARQ